MPIATMVSALTGLPAIFVRKEAKPYGTCRLAEGGDFSGRTVTLIEDMSRLRPARPPGFWRGLVARR